MHRFTMAVLGMVLTGLVAPAWTGWSETPLQKWLDGPTLEVVPGVTAPFAMWAEKDGMLMAKGTAPCWDTRLAPGDPGPDTKVTVRFTVRASSKLEPLLPPTVECVRWAYHWHENSPGWDVGVVLRWKDALNFYRVQLSAHRGELALWDSTGGWLARVRCGAKVGQTHTLAIVTHGPHIQASLDGKAVLDYWDRTLPHLGGQVGLSVWKSQVEFQRFEVARLGADVTPMPAHKPDFRFVPVGGQVMLYDGVEPICRFLKTPKGFGEKDALFISWVKLKPGYRPAYYTWIGPGISEGAPYVLPLVGELPDAFKVDKTGEVLTFRFQTNRPDTAKADHVCTIRYDAERGVYRYEFRAKVAFTLTRPFQLNSFELIDPLTYNNRQSGPEVLHRWNWAEHRWHVFEGPSRTWERYPLIDYLREYGNPPAYWGDFTDFLYPDPGACPTFEVELGWQQQPNRDLQLGLCHWGYDFHHAEAGHGGVIQPGTTRDYAVTLTAMPPAEAEALYRKSVVAPKVAASKERYANFNPKGCTFDAYSTRPNPTSTMVWTDGVIDETVGRKDSCSLRIDGPGIGKVQMYQYAVEQNATHWWVRGWTRSRGVVGRGLQLRVKYSYAAKPEQVFYLDGRGDRDWTYFSYVTDVLKQRDCTDISLELDGSGQVWIDDVAVSALTDGSMPRQTDFPLPTELKPSTERMIDLAMSEKPGSGVYDASHNGHHLMLAGGPKWVQEEGRGFLRLDGVGDYGTIPLKPRLEPLDYQAPQALFKCLFPLKAFTYEFWARPNAPVDKSGTMTLFHYRFNPIVRFDQFKADGTCRLYFQNDRRRPEDTWTASGQARIETRVPVGQWLHVVATHADGTMVLYVNGKPAGRVAYDPRTPGFEFFEYQWHYRVGCWYGQSQYFHGDIGPIRLYSKALTAKEVTTLLTNGWPTR
jgi:hypothetical protein